MCSDESEREIMAWDVYLQSQEEDHKAPAFTTYMDRN